MGNQFVKTFSVAKIGKVAGITGAVVGTFIDGYGVIRELQLWANLERMECLQRLALWGQ